MTVRQGLERPPPQSNPIVSVPDQVRQTVETPGKAEPLVDYELVLETCQVIALPDNDALVWVGGAGVSGVAGFECGNPLDAGDVLRLPLNSEIRTGEQKQVELHRWFVDAPTAGDGVTVVWD